MVESAEVLTDEHLISFRITASHFLWKMVRRLVGSLVEVGRGNVGAEDFARLIERIRQRKADGLTALYDALGTYLDGADSQDGRKVMVMYTDGGDTRSALSFSD